MIETAMTKKNRTIAIRLVTISILLFSGYFIGEFYKICCPSYSKELPFYSVTVKNDTAIKIGIIGDSWVSGGKLDSILQYGLFEKGIKNHILSTGHSGATSKLIYQNLFKENGNEYSSKFIIESNPDFCIIIAGVNDAVGQLSGHFYSYHMKQIVKTLLHYKIKPIIVSCPELGIKEFIDNQLNFKGKLATVISAYFNNNGEIDNIKTYRKILSEELAYENLEESVITIDFDNVCSDYNKCQDLYANPSHLNEKGNNKLVQVIIEELIKELTTR